MTISDVVNFQCKINLNNLYIAMEININYKKMSYISQLSDAFKFIDGIHENNVNVYLDFDNISKLINIAHILYKNVPSYRTQMISNNKSYHFKNDISDLLNIIINGTVSAKIRNIFIITNNKDMYDQSKNNKAIMINHDEFNSIISVDKHFSLIIDVNNKKINNISNKENIYMLILQLV